MRTVTRAGSSALLLALLVATGAAAQVPRVLIGDVPCIPRNGHGLVQAVAGPLESTDEVRVYFRRTGYGDFYWVPARPTSDGRFWAVLPVPEPDNHQAELYAAVVSANNLPRAQSRIVTSPVEANCRVPLGVAQTADSDHLTVGETSLGQKFRKVAWWQCEGVRERIDVRGESRDDETCLPIAWWERPGMLAPVALLTGGTTGINVVPTTVTPNVVSPSDP